jgi:hypothetical protein
MVATSAESSIPAAGADSAFFNVGNLASGTTNYGTMIGTLNTGNGYIQQQRFDGTATTYNLLLQPNGGRVGIGTPSPDYELDVAGDIGVDHVIYHNGDGNTYHQFTTDRQRFVVGSELLLDLYEDGTQDYVKLGDGGDVDINLNDNMFVEGSSGAITFNNAYTFPTSDGSAGQFLKTNGSGSVQFSDGDIDYTDLGSGSLGLNDNNKTLIFSSSSASWIVDYPSSTMFSAGTNVDNRLITATGATNGVTLNGEANLTFDASSNLDLLSDSGKLRIGADSELEIYHNGTNDFIDSGGTAMFFRQGTTEKIKFNSAGNIQFNNAQADINTRFGTTGSTNTLWIDGGTDRVGIGTNSPAGKLDVAGSASANNLIIGASMHTVGGGHLSNYQTLLFKNTYNETGYAAIRHFANSHSDSASQLRFLTANTSGVMSNNMVIDDTGFVGIGTTSPTTPLHVAGLVQIAESGESAFYGGNYVRMFGTQSFTFRNSGGSIISQIGLNGNSYFNGGNVGINDASPGHKLDVNGNINTTGSYKMDDTDVMDTNKRLVNLTSAVGTDRSGGTHIVDFATPATPGSTGWYTICKASSANARGGGIINISATGGSITPVTITIDFFVNWSGDLNRCNIQGLSAQFTKVRLIETASTTELQIYVNTTVSQDVYMSFEKDRYNPNYSLLSTWTTATPTVTGHEILISNTSVYSNTANTSTLVISDNARRLLLGRDSIKSTDLSGSTAELYINSPTTFSSRIKLTSSGVLQWGSSANYGQLNWDGDSAIVQGQSGKDLDLRSGSSRNILFKIGSSQKAIIDSSGNIGIGTQSPGALFTVRKDGTQASSVSATYQIQTVSDSNGGIAIQAGSSSTAYLTFGDNGDYDAGRIGYKNASHDLCFFTNNEEEMVLDSDGDLHVDRDVVAYSTTPSDRRLKKNIKDIDYGLDIIMSLNPKQYDWKKDDRHDIGFIAQEVEEVIPEIVKDKKHFDKEIKTLDYEKLTAVLIKAVQEQQQQINKLEEKLNG